MPAAQRVDALLADYGASHQTRGNRVCHAFGITLIVFGILSLLLSLRLGPALSAAEILIAATFLIYSTLEVRLAIMLPFEAVLLDLLARAVGDWRVGAAAFVLGWVFQGIGHARYEKRSPAFFGNLVHLMVGPLFLINELVRIRPVAPP
ncbi:MAG TPA: Mpo1-like protein [Thermoanaerobaculia bacterium]|nr:Mpo1-like protein [Thermoanaerobaculia bacterium]